MMEGYNNGHKKESKAAHLEEKLRMQFGFKLEYSGGKSEAIKRVHAISTNKKGSAVKNIVAEGIWLNQLVLKHGCKVETIICCLDEIRTCEAENLLMNLCEKADKICLISTKTLETIAEAGNSAGLVSIVAFEKLPISSIPLSKNTLILVLDGLEIPGNIGTLVRSADGVDAHGVIITNKKTRLTHPKYIRSSQGSCFKVPVVETETDTTISWLIENNFRILLADTDAQKNYYEEAYRGRVAIVLGSERYGISSAYYDTPHTTIGIPMFGECDSLNVGIAGTVILYEAALKQKGMLKR